MIVRKVKSLEFHDGDGENVMRVNYDNSGEPWREGVSFEFCGEPREWCRVLLDEDEVRELRDKLSELLGEGVR